jgi:hypothetical protein
MVEWLKTYYRFIWWVARFLWWIAMLIFFSVLTLRIWSPTLCGDFTYIKGNGIILLLVWIALLLWPLFKEINLFGLSLKKEIDSLRTEIKEQRLEFREQIVNLKSEIRVQNIINIPPSAEGVKSTAGVGKTPPDLETKELWEESIKVLSTLWKHQQQYAPQFWGFVVGPGSPNYRTYAIGVGETMKLGLTTVNAENGMVFLTVQGIEYCKKNKGKLKDDWDYNRWQKPD